MTGLKVIAPKTILTLSAAPDLLPEDARSAAYIDRLVGRIARAERRGDRVRAARLEARLIDYVWGPAA